MKKEAMLPEYRQQLPFFDFKVVEFHRLKKEAGLHTFVLSVSEWIVKTAHKIKKEIKGMCRICKVDARNRNFLSYRVQKGRMKHDHQRKS